MAETEMDPTTVVVSDELRADRERIHRRVAEITEEVNRITTAALRRVTTPSPGPIAFHYTGTGFGGSRLLAPEERAQSIGFIIRYDNLPADLGVKCVAIKGKHYVQNMAYVRHALNDHRSLIQNEKDSLHYLKIHKTWERMLARTDDHGALRVRALTPTNLDVTPMFLAWLSERKKVIGAVLHAMEFGYLYNGILQHSDPHYSDRFLADYTSGELQYILWKHVLVLAFIRDMLTPYYNLAKALTFPTPGPL